MSKELQHFKKEAALILEDLEIDPRLKRRMPNVVHAAISRDSSLLNADRQSFWAAVRQMASWGIVPDGNEGFLAVRSTKDPETKEYIKKVVPMSMVRGIINRVQNSGKVDVLWAECVYEGEKLVIDRTQGDRRPQHHIPDELARAEKLIGVYAVAKLSNGSVDCEVLSLADIAKIRSVATTDNVWKNWFSEKCKVAAIRRLSKRLPLSSEDREFVMGDPAEHDFTKQAQPMRDVTPLAQRLGLIEPEKTGGNNAQDETGQGPEVIDAEPEK